MSGEGSQRNWLVVAHHHPGRLRVRSPRFEVDQALRDAIERWLAEHPGVRAVSSEGTAGSVLVVYDPTSTDAGELLIAIATRTRMVVLEQEPREAPARRVFAAARALDRLVSDASGGRFGLGVAFPAALGLGSIASFVLSSHARPPRWDNLLWWGWQLFREFSESEPPGPRVHANGG